MTNVSNPAFVSGLADLAPLYRALLCDVWGVVHDGVSARLETCEALTRYRDGGGRVVLITNAPRPSPPIVGLLDGLGVPREAYDEIVSSGDMTRVMLEEYRGRRRRGSG